MAEGLRAPALKTDAVDPNLSLATSWLPGLGRASYLLCVCLFICEMGILTVPASQGEQYLTGITRVNMCQILRIAPWFSAVPSYSLKEEYNNPDLGACLAVGLMRSTSFPFQVQQDMTLKMLSELMASHRMRFFLGCPFTWRARGNEAIKLQIKVAIEFSFPLQRIFQLWHSVQFLHRGYWWCAIFHYVQHSTLWTQRKKALLTCLGDSLSVIQVESIQVETPLVDRVGFIAKRDASTGLTLETPVSELVSRT